MPWRQGAVTEAEIGKVWEPEAKDGQHLESEKRQGNGFSPRASTRNAFLLTHFRLLNRKITNPELSDKTAVLFQVTEFVVTCDTAVGNQYREMKRAKSLATSFSDCKLEIQFGALGITPDWTFE